MQYHLAFTNAFTGSLGLKGEIVLVTLSSAANAADQVLFFFADGTPVALPTVTTLSGGGPVLALVFQTVPFAVEGMATALVIPVKIPIFPTTVLTIMGTAPIVNLVVNA